MSNICELCGDVVIGEYCSTTWCNDYGVGVCLHEACCNGLQNMPLARAVRVLETIKEHRANKAQWRKLTSPIGALSIKETGSQL